MTIEIVSLKKQYAKRVAQLHIEGIATGFLSKLGVSFLRRLYVYINKAPDSRVFVAVDETGTPIGFLSGSLDMNKMYRHIIIRKGVLLFILLLPNIFSLKTIQKIIETMLYPLKGRAGKYENKKNASPLSPLSTCGEGKDEVGGEAKAELLSIAVDKSARGKGVGKKLVLAFEHYLKEIKCTQYKVVTFSLDKNSNNFYESCGFTLAKSFMHHGNLLNQYFKTVVK